MGWSSNSRFVARTKAGIQGLEGNTSRIERNVKSHADLVSLADKYDQLANSVSRWRKGYCSRHRIAARREGKIMVSDSDIHRAARLMIERYGDRAEIEAARRHGEMLVRDDPKDTEVWSRIRRAIRDLQVPPPRGLMH
jgi:hypothetical protein